MYQVIIVDDEKYVRKSIKARIDWGKYSCEIAAEADNGLSALELMDNTPVDIMLIDIKMPKLSGLELIEQIRRKNPDLQIAIISGHDNFSYTKQAMRLQVSDFIKKPINASDLEQAISIMVGRIEAQKKKSDELFDITNKVNKFNSTIHMKEINSICENPEASVTLLSESKDEKYGWVLFYFSPLSQSQKKIGNEQWEDIRNCFKELFSDKHINIAYHISFNELLMNEIRILIPESQGAIPKICDYLFARIMNRYMDQFSSIHAASTDSYHPIDKLHMSYNQTLHLLKEKIFITKSCIVKSDMCNEPDAKKAELLFTMLERLKEIIKTRQFIKVEAILKKMLSNPSYLSVSSLESIILGIHSLATEYSVLYEIKMSEFFPYQLTGKYTLLTYSDLEHLYNTLESFIFSFFFESSQFEDDHVITQVKKYIAGNLSEKLGTSQIANIFFFNPSYLSQLFKKHTNMTLTKYIEEQRMGKACDLLVNFDMTITEVAGEVGYPDANYFSKVFSKQMKISPTEYKNLTKRDANIERRNNPAK